MYLIKVFAVVLFAELTASAQYSCPTGQFVNSQLANTGQSCATPNVNAPYPSEGVPLSTGTAWGTSFVAPAVAIVGTTDTQTLTNKTIDSPVLTGTTQADEIISNDFIGPLNGVAIGGTPPVSGNVLLATDPTHAIWGNNSPTGTGFWFSTNGVRDAAARTILPQDLPATISSDTTGNANTSSAFNHTPTSCQPVSGVTTYPTGIDSQGNGTGCSSPTGSGQPGSVTTITVDDIPGIADTTVTNASTTPHVSFTLFGAPAHSFWGNNTDTEDGSVGYSNITISDLPEEIAGTQAHNSFWAAPDGTNGIPSFRTMLPTDITGLPAFTPIMNGSTGVGSISYISGSTNITLTSATSLDFITGGNVRQMQLDASGNLNFGVNLGRFMDTSRNIFPGSVTSSGNIVVSTGNITVSQGTIQSAEGLQTPNGSVVTGGLFTDNRTLTMTDTTCGTSVSGVENVLLVNGSAITTNRVCPITLEGGAKGLQFTVIKIDSNSLAQFNVNGGSGSTVNGQAGYTLYQQYQSVTVQSDGTNWHVIAQNNPNIVNDQPANLVLASPNGSFGHVGYRTLQMTDTPFAAPLASPALTGTPTAPTAASNTNTTQIATTAMVQAAIAAETPSTEIFGQVTIAAGDSEGNDSSHSGISVSSVCVASPMNPISGTPNTNPWEFVINLSQSNIAIVAQNVMAQKQTYSFICRP